MTKVIGVGGVFRRARDVARMGEWYVRVLGINLNLGRGTTFDRSLGSDSLVLRFFDRARSYIGDPEHQNVMVNHVVDDLGGFLNHVRECGVDDEPVQVEPYGRFSWATDPEGNRLWEASPVETTD